MVAVDAEVDVERDELLAFAGRDIEREGGGDGPLLALVSMPFFSVRTPSIQIGGLRATVRAAGLKAVSLHLVLDFAAQLGSREYEALSRHNGRMLGEWLFSLEAFGTDAPDLDGSMLAAFADEFGSMSALGDDPLVRLAEIREVEVPRYLDRLMETVPWDAYEVIGFSSTFQQSVASFALSRRIKDAWPGLVTLFGGSNFEQPMGSELVASVDAVDYAIAGEAELALPAFLRALRDAEDPTQIRGVLSRGSTQTEQTLPVTDLDAVPDPDYHEYFERGALLNLTPTAGGVKLPYQSARGCWWGQKHHCTFCGLNGSGMSFRGQSAERVRAGLERRTREYRSFRHVAVDNIMPRSYVTDLFPALAASEAGYQLFYEIKSNLDRASLKALRAGGVTGLQPGIESLSTPTLKLMRKGVTGIQNVNTMRWSHYYGINVDWNVLWGFPGERVEDVTAQLRLFRMLHHLQPPVGGGRIWLERYSPLFDEYAADPEAGVRAELSYRFVYPARANLDRLAYLFHYEFKQALPDEVFASTLAEIADWRSAWSRGERRPALTYRQSGDVLEVRDARGEELVIHWLEEPQARIYAGCSTRQATASKLSRELGIEPALVTDALEEMVDRELMMRDGEHYLSLALPAARGRW